MPHGFYAHVFASKLICTPSSNAMQSCEHWFVNMVSNLLIITLWSVRTCEGHFATQDDFASMHHDSCVARIRNLWSKMQKW